jgi:Spy/CpxP family protein refolding chaperone
MRSKVKETTLTVAAIVAMAWTLPAAYGQPAATQPVLPSGFMSLPGGGWGSYEEFFKVCELDKDQLKKVSDIELKRRADFQNSEKAFQKAQKASTKAQADNDANALAETQANGIKASVAMITNFHTAQGDILAVLTPRQKASWREYVTLKDVKAHYGGIQFTDPQWDKIMDACEKLAKDSTLKLGEIYAKVNAILTPEQKAKWLFANARYAEMEKVCHFTPEQIDKLVPIEGERCKTEAELRGQKELIFKAEREAMAAGDRNIVTVQPMWQDWNKRNSEADEQVEQKIQSLLTDKQKAAWKNASVNKGAGKPTSN